MAQHLFDAKVTCSAEHVHGEADTCTFNASWCAKMCSNGSTTGGGEVHMDPRPRLVQLGQGIGKVS